MPLGTETSSFSVAGWQTLPTPLPGTSSTNWTARWFAATFVVATELTSAPVLSESAVFGFTAVRFGAFTEPAASAPAKSLKTVVRVVPLAAMTSSSAPTPSAAVPARAATCVHTSRTASSPNRSVRYWKKGQRAWPL